MHSPSLVLRPLLGAIVGLAALGPDAFAWTPPIGIPAPAFGIEETVDDATYTHWVDNSRPCSNSGNGSPTAPRCTIPTTLAAGSVVQVRGGPYSVGHETWTFGGTAAQPVYVRGPRSGPRPYLGNNADVEMVGRYGIVENLRMRIWTFDDGGDHLALRHSEVRDHPGTGAAVGVGSDNRHIVIYDCEIAGNGVIPSSGDHHGINLYDAGIADVWIVDNHIHHNSGDAIQFCHSCNTAGPPNDGPARVYIGRNEMHDDEENAIDLKEFIGPVVISQNRMYGYAVGLDSNGEALRVNDEGAQGQLWIVFNDIWDSELGINADEAAASAIYIVGNEIHDIHDTAVYGVPLAGSASVRVVDNTIVGVPDAILVGEVRGNIVQATGTAIGAGGGGCSHNLVAEGDVDRFCANGRSGDPGLVRAGIHVTGLQPESPAVDAGFPGHAAYTTFQNAFGTSIQTDCVGVARPQGSGWDMGAYELAADVIFRDGFETGDFFQWSTAVSDGGDLSVAPPGMAGTTWGLTGLEDDTHSLYVQDDTPTGEARYRARFYLDPSLFDPGTALGHLRTRVLIVYSEPSRRVAAIVLRKLAGQFALMGRARLDDGAQADTGFFPITPGPHAVELDLRAASGPFAADGGFTLWIDGAQVRALAGLDNSQSRADFVRMGALSLKPGATGVLRFDEFESRTQSYIGPLP